MPMPPPGVGAFDDIRFVTNYLLAGCTITPDLIFELNTDAAASLAVMLVTFDFQDIVQGFFDPKSSRKTRPARHGGKRRPINGIPDINDFIGQKVKVVEMNRAIQKLPGAKFVLPGINIIEGVTIAAFVAEGVTDIAFDNLIGLLELNPNHCREFPRWKRDRIEPQIIGGAGIGGFDSINLDQKQVVTGFVSEGRTANTDKPWACAFQCVLHNDRQQGPLRGAVEIRGLDGVTYATTGDIELGEGETESYALSASVPPNVPITWGWKIGGNFSLCLSASGLGYGESGWLDWI